MTIVRTFRHRLTDVFNRDSMAYAVSCVFTFRHAPTLKGISPEPVRISGYITIPVSLVYCSNAIIMCLAFSSLVSHTLTASCSPYALGSWSLIGFLVIIPSQQHPCSTFSGVQLYIFPFIALPRRLQLSWPACAPLGSSHCQYESVLH